MIILETRFDDHNDSQESVKRFEDMLRNNNNEYLDENSYDYIIHHYLRQGKHDKAIKACQLALEHHPLSIELKFFYASTLLEAGDSKEVIRVINEVLLLQPTDSEYLSIKAEALLLEEEYFLAEEIYLNILPLAENKAHIYYQLSEAAQGQSLHEKAINYLLNALKLNPKNEEIMFELYHSYEQLGRIDECIKQLHKFIDESPYSKHSWYNLGILLDKLNRFEEAIDAYEFAVAIDENFSSAHYNMGVALMSLQKHQDALTSLGYAEEIESENDPLLFQSIAHCYFELDEDKQALNYYKKALNLVDSLHEAWYGIGLIFEKKEKWIEAIHFFKKAHQLDHTVPKYLRALAHTEFQLGNYYASTEYFNKALALDPKEVHSWLCYSYIFYEQDDTDKAFNIILDAIEELPEEAELHYRACCYLMKKGKLKEAFIYLENALILNFEKHVMLFDFFPELETQKALMRVIDEFRKD